VKGETDPERRQQILSTVMDFDEAVFQRKVGHAAPFLDEGLEQDRAYRASLTKARARVLSVEVPEKIAGQCISLAAEFNIEGHRGDYVLALAGRALAALEGKQQVTAQHLESVASLALHHRRREFLQSGQWFWSADDDRRVAKVLSA
jgi:magnesium chelatase subunit I